MSSFFLPRLTVIAVLMAGAVADVSELRAPFALAHKGAEERLEAMVQRGQAEGVIRKALNADMPFDEFTVRQLAGDLLPSASLALHWNSAAEAGSEDRFA